MSFRPICDTWICGRPKVKYYGAYPAGFLERARWMLPVTPSDTVLHVCAGMVRLYSSPDYGVKAGVPLRGFYPNDLTLDMDDRLTPDILADVSSADWSEVVRLSIEPHMGRNCVEPHVKHRVASSGGFRGILIDRPYTEADAGHYAPGSAKLPAMKVLLQGAHDLLCEGGRVGILDFIWPRPPVGLHPVAKISVTCGYANRDRCFSVFERR